MDVTKRAEELASAGRSAGVEHVGLEEIARLLAELEHVSTENARLKRKLAALGHDGCDHVFANALHGSSRECLKCGVME